MSEDVGEITGCGLTLADALLAWIVDEVNRREAEAEALANTEK